MKKTQTGLPILNAVLAAWLVHSCTTDRVQSAVARPVSVDATPVASPAARPDLVGLRNAFSDVAEAALPSVVTVIASKDIDVRDFQGGPFGPDMFRFFLEPHGRGPGKGRREPQGHPKSQGIGSGVIVRKDGTVLTNNHVVAEADELKVRLSDGRTLPAKVVGTDERADLAVLRIEAKEEFPAARLGDSDRLRVGEWVLCIGSPMSVELGHTVTAGIVSAKGRSSVGLADYEDYIQTDAAINPGNSGGPMLNLDGEVVGVNTAISSRSGGNEGIGFAVPSSMAKVIMDQLIEHGKVVRGWLGVMIQNVGQDLAEAMELPDTRGAVVGEVVEDGPAAKAGLKPGDVIRSVAGRAAVDVAEVRNRIALTAPGTDLALGVLRDGEERTVHVTIGELVGDGGRAVPSGGGSTGGVERLGLKLRSVDSPISGVRIEEVDPAGAAAKAGLVVGDVIVEVGREAVTKPEEVQTRLAATAPGKTALLRVNRAGGSLFVALRMPEKE